MAEQSEPAPVVDSKAVVHGAGWRALEVIGGEGTALLVFLVLARLLVPEDFGLVAMASVIVSLGRELLARGLPEGLICAETYDATTYATAFWLNLAFGAILTLLLVAIAPAAAWAFDEPKTLWVLICLAPGVLLGSATGILGAKLRREMRFKGFAMRGMLATAAGATVAIPMALLGYGVWALVAQQVTTALTSVIVFAHAVGIDAWPSARPSRTVARSLLSFSVPIALSGFMRFVADRLDLAVIGMMTTTNLVGAYFLAKRISRVLLMGTSHSIEQLALPALAGSARAGGDREQHAYLALRWTGYVCMPPAAILAVLAPEAVNVLAGSKWVAADGALVGLALAGALQALGPVTSGQILLAAGRTRPYQQLSMANATLALCGAALGAFLGDAQGAGLGVATGQLAGLPFWLLAAGKTAARQRPHRLLSALRLPTLASVGGALVTWATSKALATTPDWVRIVLGGLGGLAVLTLIAAPELRLVIRGTDPAANERK